MDDTLGRNPRVLQGPDYAIGPKAGRQAGRNLFYSFETFSLATGERATFSGPDEIRRIISRVTGGERSDIDGTIKSNIAGTDFYFINPAGVMFGQHASLDVKGSFYVSTADELRFADGKVVSATNPTSSLTVAAPETFGFLRAHSGSIEVRGSTLEAAPQATLSLVGGDLLIDRAVLQLRDFETRNGNVTLVATSQAGEVAVADGRPSAAQGEILVSGGGIDASSAAGGGVVRIRGGTLVVEDGFIVADNFGGEPGAATALIVARSPQRASTPPTAAS